MAEGPPCVTRSFRSLSLSQASALTNGTALLALDLLGAATLCTQSVTSHIVCSNWQEHQDMHLPCLSAGICSVCSCLAGRVVFTHLSSSLGATADPGTAWLVQKRHQQNASSCETLPALLPRSRCASQLSSANSLGPECWVGHLCCAISQSHSRVGETHQQYVPFLLAPCHTLLAEMKTGHYIWKQSTSGWGHQWEQASQMRNCGAFTSRVFLPCLVDRVLCSWALLFT